MSPIAWITLMVVPLIAFYGIFQVNLVSDVIASTGYPTAEVEAGIGTIWVFFMVVLGIFTVRP